MASIALNLKAKSMTNEMRLERLHMAEALGYPNLDLPNQRKIFARAVDAGWDGTVPTELNTAAAYNQLTRALKFLSEPKKKV